MAHSNFNTLAGDSFHLMQQDWKLEIADRLTEIRVKENVSSNVDLLSFLYALFRICNTEIRTTGIRIQIRRFSSVLF